MESIKHTLKMLSAVTIEIFFFFLAEFSANVPWTQPSYLLTSVVNSLCQGVCLQLLISFYFLEQKLFPGRAIVLVLFHPQP